MICILNGPVLPAKCLMYFGACDISTNYLIFQNIDSLTFYLDNGKGDIYPFNFSFFPHNYLHENLAVEINEMYVD